MPIRVLPGIDLVDTERIAGVIERQGEAFLRRVFTDTERAYCESHAAPRAKHASYAARWAAKEAVAKALGTGIGEHAALHEIEVTRSDSGQPGILLHGRAAETAARMGVREITVSLSHTESTAAAFVIVRLRAT